MDSRLIKCFNCLREEKTNSEKQLKKEFINAPWITLQDIQLPQIDKIDFNRIRDNIASVYYERVRKGIANDFDKIQAVLFYTKKKPAEISQQESEQIIAILARDERIKE